MDRNSLCESYYALAFHPQLGSESEPLHMASDVNGMMMTIASGAGQGSTFAAVFRHFLPAFCWRASMGQVCILWHILSEFYKPTALKPRLVCVIFNFYVFQFMIIQQD